MAFRTTKHGKIDDKDCLPFCYRTCNPPPCHYSFSFICPPPPPTPPPPPSSPNQNLSILLFILVSALGLCFLLIVYYAIFSKFCSNRNRSTTPETQNSHTHEEILDETHSSVVDHHIWYINTVGLDPAVINSITVCKYRKGDGLIEGTDCSVCLSEFEEDETLRILPKCSHAFHLPCIDTWLRSHTNCPLCRAPIVLRANSIAKEANLAGSSNSGSMEEPQIENMTGEGEEGIIVQGGSSSFVDNGKGGVSMSIAECEMQVFDELTERGGEVEDGVQPVRRSVSLDPSIAASTFWLEGGSSHSEVVEKNSELVGSSSSSGGLLPKVQNSSVVRSFSSGARFFLSRSNRARGPVLPL